MNQELENVTLNIDKAFEDIKPMDYEGVINDLRERLKSKTEYADSMEDRWHDASNECLFLKAKARLMNEGLIYFIHRVDCGTIKSKKTYEMFKSILVKVKDMPKQDRRKSTKEERISWLLKHQAE